MSDELLVLSRQLRRRLRSAPPAPRPRGAPARVPSQVVPAAAADPGTRLRELASEIDSCRRCPLGAARIKSVPGVGSPRARVMFVGEGPGYEEDRRGEPFVGPAGRLLDRILAAIGLSRSDVFIANTVKCHPMKDPARPDARGNDRAPSPEEMAACRPFLDEQIRTIAPRVVVALGAPAARALTGSSEGIGRLRGQWTTLSAGGRTVKLLPTYHPAALLRDPELKRPVWKDMQALRAELADPEAEAAP